MLEYLKKTPLKMRIILLAIILFLAGGSYLYFAWNNPLGEELDIPTPTELVMLSSPTELVMLSTPTAKTISTPQPEHTDDSPTLTPTIEPVCGAPPTMTILLSGGAPGKKLFGLADSIRVVRLDFQRQEVAILALPRDLWVSIPGASSHGVEFGKLNQAYFYGTEGMGFFDGSGYGSGLLAHTLQENFSVTVDNYMAVNIFSLRQIVDGIGGIDVYFPEPIYTKWFNEPKLYLKSGFQHLNGKQAEKVVRTRIDIGDFGRINNQTLVLKALAAKMMTLSGIAQLPELVNRLDRYILTDLSPSDISKVICLAGKIDYKEDIIYETLPEDLLTGEWVLDEYQGYKVYALTYDEEVISELLASFQAGLWPEQ